MSSKFKILYWIKNVLWFYLKKGSFPLVVVAIMVFLLLKLHQPMLRILSKTAFVFMGFAVADIYRCWRYPYIDFSVALADKNLSPRDKVLAISIFLGLITGFAVIGFCWGN